ncbi:cytochrome P450 [Mycobacterium sp. EPa45]|uniref:cytochrome P450 n=1 Tax=Mycobacterium sp. EPa45 TaxID=1545728 RepID=UPI000641E5FA|nr:cytochrome P450 [Mycobacterium sp. EPa45]AKK25497.1 cytochrome P450 [Mycobacterium sp. EPa45]
MTIGADRDIYFDPYDVELNADPYPMYRRLREEAPLYYNEQHDFYALSRFEDVNQGLIDYETYTSSRGAFLEIIRAEMPIPPCAIVFEDPPVHDIHRSLLSRMFTPRKIKALEPQIRDYTVRCLDAVAGTGRFDFVNDLGAQMPMRVIGMLLGIPEGDQDALREQWNDAIRTEAGQPMDVSTQKWNVEDVYAEYIDWRVTHPSDDIITELLNVEFTDEHGVRRRLSKEELLTFVHIVSGAGSETTTRLIGWAAKVLAEHPDQRRDLVENPALIPQALEELVRFEPPAPHMARYVTRDVELYGQTVREGSIMMLLIGAACRDDRQFPPNGDVFNIHREARQHLGYAVGVHYCLGSALARLEGRVAMEEILKRYPEWELDMDNAVLSATSTVRGWDAMPTFVRKG